MPRKISIILLVLAFAAHGVSQTLQTRKVNTPAQVHKLTFNQLAAAAKMYLRESVELPLSVDLSMLAISASGRTLKKDHGTAVYDYHGYNPRSERDTGTFKHISTKGLFHSTKWVQPVAWNSFVATTIPSIILFKEVNFTAKRYSLDGGEPSADSQFVTARMSPRPGKCSNFKWSTKEGAPEEFCGTSQFKLQKDDLSFRHFSFDAGALPIATTVKPFGKCELRSYHAEVEFQKVTLPDDPKPFLVPKHVEVVVETDKGKLKMTIDYTPKK